MNKIKGRYISKCKRTELTLTEKLKARKQCAWEHLLACILYTTHIKRGEMFINYFFPDSKIQILPYYSFVKPKQSTPLQLFLSIFKGNKHLGLDPQKSQHRLKKQSLDIHTPLTYPCQIYHLDKCRPVHCSLWLGDWIAKEQPLLHSHLNWSCCWCPHYNYHNRQTSRMNRVFSFLFVKYVLSKNKLKKK